VNLGAALATALVALSFGAEAAACSRSGVYGEPFTLASDWRLEFKRQFDDAEAVYLARVVSAGQHTPILPRAACDIEAPFAAMPPPPLPSRRHRKKADIVEHQRWLREMPAREAAVKAQQVACQPEKARFVVEETLKGGAIAEWVETRTLIDVVNDRAPEPVTGWDRLPAYYRDVFKDFEGPCGVPPARRLSEAERYVVFLHGDFSSPGGSAGWTKIGRSVRAAYLVRGSTPFLTEALRLSALPHVMPYDANRPRLDAVVSDQVLQATADAASQAAPKKKRP
jgi:hypothetical protein